MRRRECCRTALSAAIARCRGGPLSKRDAVWCDARSDAQRQDAPRHSRAHAVERVVAGPDKWLRRPRRRQRNTNAEPGGLHRRRASTLCLTERSRCYRPLPVAAAANQCRDFPRDSGRCAAMHRFYLQQAPGRGLIESAQRSELGASSSPKDPLMVDCLRRAESRFLVGRSHTLRRRRCAHVPLAPCGAAPAPSRCAPANLLGLVNGLSLALAWDEHRHRWSAHVARARRDRLDHSVDSARAVGQLRLRPGSHRHLHAGAAHRTRPARAWHRTR